MFNGLFEGQYCRLFEGYGSIPVCVRPFTNVFISGRVGSIQRASLRVRGVHVGQVASKGKARFTGMLFDRDLYLRRECCCQFIFQVSDRVRHLTSLGNVANALRAGMDGLYDQVVPVRLFNCFYEWDLRGQGQRRLYASVRFYPLAAVVRRAFGSVLRPR